MKTFCQCRRCKKEKRRGLILGSRRQYIHRHGGLISVSDYVPYHRLAKGRRPDRDVRRDIDDQL